MSDSERASAFATTWWLLALRGLAAVAFGVVALVFPLDTFYILVIAFAAACLVDGLTTLALAVHGVRRGRTYAFLLLHGLAATAIGASVFVSPPVTALTLVSLVAAWSILSGILLLDLGVLCRDLPGRALLLTVAAASLVFGLFLLAAPALGVVALVWWLGVNAIVVGLALLVLAFGFKQGGYNPALR